MYESTMSETIHEADANEDLSKIMAGSETNANMFETPDATGRMQDSPSLPLANRELAEQVRFSHLEPSESNANENPTKKVVKSKYEGSMADKIKMQGYPQGLNPLQSKEELAEQLGLSFQVYSKVTRGEMMESLREAILSEPGYHEANNDFELPPEGIESGSGVDKMESTSLNSIEISQSNENDQMQNIAVKVEKSHTDIDRYVEGSSVRDKIGIENHKEVFGPRLRNYTSNHCQKDYKREANLEKHIQHQHELPNKGNPSTSKDKIYHSCNHCNETFSVQRELKRHLAKMHKNLDDERKYICDICRKSYKRQGNLDNHQQVDHGIEKEASTQNNIKLCSLCSKYFTGMQSLKCHLRRIHGNQENVICSDCGKCFKDKNCLSNLVKNVHMVTNDQCGKCNKICKNKPALEKHMIYNHS